MVPPTIPAPPEQPPGESSATDPATAVAAPLAPYAQPPAPPQAQPPAPPVAPPQPQPLAPPPAAKAKLPLPEQATAQRAIAALFLAMLSLFGLLGLNNLPRGSYIIGFALLSGAIAIWLASTAISRAKRGGTMRPRGSVTALLIGAVGVLISCFLLIVLALFGKQVSTFSQCVSGAGTIAARQACQSQLIRSIEGP